MIANAAPAKSEQEPRSATYPRIVSPVFGLPFSLVLAVVVADSLAPVVAAELLPVAAAVDSFEPLFAAVLPELFVVPELLVVPELPVLV